MKILKKIYYEKYTKKSYAISGVDLVIDRMFKNTKNGVYIDVGCNHPIKYNNTYLLYRRGWTGINIDLDKNSINQFNELRPKDYNVQAVVSDTDSIKEIFYYHERSAINTLSKDLVNSRKNKPKKIIKEQSTTLNTIIKKSFFKDKKTNIISIDIENHEFEALKNFNFKEIKADKYDKKFKAGLFRQIDSFRTLISSGKLIWPSQNLNDSLKTMLLIKKISRNG